MSNADQRADIFVAASPSLLTVFGVLLGSPIIVLISVVLQIRMIIWVVKFYTETTMVELHARNQSMFVQTGVSSEQPAHR